MGGSRHFTQEQKFAILETGKGVGIKAAAEMAGVHFTSVYDWRRQLNDLGKEDFLKGKPPSPGRGIKKITEAQEKAVLECWGRYAGFGPSQVRNQLRRQGITISTRSVQRIMEGHGYEGMGRKPKERESLRFEASRPLELVQVDILEFFIHKLKIYVLLLLDDFSRFILGWRLLEETSIDAVIGLMREAIGRYGKMEEVLSDRGFVFYSWRGANRFERFLEAQGIHHTHASAHHPQTLGKIEAANRQLQKELIGRKAFCSVNEAQGALGQWVETYNYQRTHQGLGGLLVPADRFHGRVKEVLKRISDGLDPATDSCYARQEVARSLVNVVLEPEGGVRLYVLGQPIKLFGGDHGREVDPAGGRVSDPSPQAS
jgi:putative transposase